MSLKGDFLLADLKVPTMIGVYDHEKIDPQTLSVSLAFSVDIEKAAHTDNLTDAVDYAEIRSVILSFAKQASFQLLEAFAASLLAHIQNQYQFPYVQLKITKYPTDMTDVSGVSLTVSDGDS